MTIAFDKVDRELVAEKLEHAELFVSDKRISDVLYNVAAALGQQFDEEADFMINEFEVS